MVNKNRLVIFIVMAIVVVVAIGIFLYIRSSEWTVSITSNPTGAGVYINDEYKGVTPLKVTLYPKANYSVYHLKLKKEGYEDVARGIQKTDVKDNNIAIELARNGKGAVIWKFNLGFEVVDSSPVASDGKVYIGSYDHYLYCLDVNDGDVVWKYKTGHVIRSTPAVSDGKVYISSFDSYLYCLNADNGSVIWKYKAEGMGYSSPSVSNGKVYIGSRNPGFYCFNANNGNIIWKYNIGIDYSSPAVYDGKVYIGLSGPALYNFNADNGSIFWKYDRERGIPPDSFFSPVASNGKIYIGSDDYCIYCFNADNGNFIWKYKVGGPIRTTPAVSDKKVYVSSEIYSGSSYTSYLYCLSADN